MPIPFRVKGDQPVIIKHRTRCSADVWHDGASLYRFLSGYLLAYVKVKSR